VHIRRTKVKPTPQDIENILRDPAFHRNLSARVEAAKNGTHPEDAEQNAAAAVIVQQQATAGNTRGLVAGIRARLALGHLLESYVTTYFPNL
jgi:hypothetical protein